MYIKTVWLRIRRNTHSCEIFYCVSTASVCFLLYGISRHLTIVCTVQLVRVYSPQSTMRANTMINTDGVWSITRLVAELDSRHSRSHQPLATFPLRLWTLTCIFICELDLHSVNVNQRVKFLGQRLLDSKVIVGTHWYTRTSDRLLYLDHK